MKQGLLRPTMTPRPSEAQSSISGAQATIHLETATVQRCCGCVGQDLANGTHAAVRVLPGAAPHVQAQEAPRGPAPANRACWSA